MRASEYQLIDLGPEGGFLATVTLLWGTDREVELEIFQLSKKVLDEIKEEWSDYMLEAVRLYRGASQSRAA